MVDSGAKTRYVNQRTADMLGWTIDEMIGVSLFDFAFDEERQALETRFAHRRHGKKEQYDGRFRRKDGSALWAIVSVSPAFDDQGAFQGSLAMITDITDRKRIETELHASERRFRRLIENSLDCIVLIGDDGRVLVASPAITPLLGYTSEEFVGQDAFSFIHPEEVSAIETAFSELLRKPGRSVRGEFRCQRQDGSWRWIEAVGANLLEDDAVRAIVTNFRDVTERREAETNLRYIIGRSRCLPWEAEVLEHITAEGVSWYEWKRLTFDEDALERFIPVDRRPGERYETAWHRCKAPEEQRRIDAISTAALRARESGYTQEFCCRGADGRDYWVHEQVSIEPLGPESWRLAGLCMDITERKTLEKTLQQQANDLAEANRRKDEFLAMLAHELRNPLAAVGSAVHLMASDGARSGCRGARSSRHRAAGAAHGAPGERPPRRFSTRPEQARHCAQGP